jgi:choline-sulfatase
MTGNNVIVFMSDEHTRSVFGAYGNQWVQTPTLDRLANEGIRFTNAYTPSPICIPGRASFATGTQVFEHGCWSSAEPYFGQHESWMHRLTRQGHDVVSIGKLHYRSPTDDLGFTDQQLGMYLANKGRGWPQGLLRQPLADFAETPEMAEGVGPGETEYTRYDRNITTAAQNWLKQKSQDPDEKPWVLFVSFICPHFPLSAPLEFYDLYRDVELPKAYDTASCDSPEHAVLDGLRKFYDYNDYFDEQNQIEGLKNYYGLCTFVDNNISKVLSALDQSEMDKNTQLIYTSDHGDLIGNHGIWGKCYMYEDSVGIPMTLTGPGINPGIVDTPVSLVDMSATIETFVTGDCIPAERPWKGRAVQSFIDNEDINRAVISEYHDGGSICGFYMIRQGPWKYVYYSEDHPDQMFNIEQDPRELNNLIDLLEFADDRDKLLVQLRDILDPEATNIRAFEDQQKMITDLGGIDAVRSFKTFNHTPID